MNPVAFHLGPLTIRWYGVFFALGFLAGYNLLQHRSRHGKIGQDGAANLTLIAMVAGVVGARILYVLQNLDEFRGRWGEAIRIDHGGLVFYGGFLLAALAVALFCRWRNYSLAEAGDLVAPALALAHGFGRIGCFLNGCCFGRVYDGALAFHYSAASDVLIAQKQLGWVEPAATACLPVFPVQLLDAVMDFAICAVLLMLAKRSSLRGRLFGVYLILYTVGRFGVEFLRGDYPSRPAGLTPAQWLCVFLLPVGIAVLCVPWRRGRAGTSVPR